MKKFIAGLLVLTALVAVVSCGKTSSEFDLASIRLYNVGSPALVGGTLQAFPAVNLRFGYAELANNVPAGTSSGTMSLYPVNFKFSFYPVSNNATPIPINGGLELTAPSEKNTYYTCFLYDTIPSAKAVYVQDSFPARHPDSAYFRFINCVPGVNLEFGTVVNNIYFPPTRLNNVPTLTEANKKSQAGLFIGRSILAEAKGQIREAGVSVQPLGLPADVIGPTTIQNNRIYTVIAYGRVGVPGAKVEVIVVAEN
jgi:hypothetical protein